MKRLLWQILVGVMRVLVQPDPRKYVPAPVEYHGFYSKEAAEFYGTSIWAAEDDIEVEVTGVAYSESEGRELMKHWPDLWYCGIVFTCVRPGRTALTEDY